VVEEQPKHDDKPPAEPGLESEGIGPLGLVIGAVTGGVAGVAAAWVGEKLIDLPGDIADYYERNEEERRRRQEQDTANLAGYRQGLDDGMNQTSSPVPPQDSRPDIDTTSSFNLGYHEGAEKAEVIRASQAGADDGRADAERHQSSAPPGGYAGNPAYEKAYDAAQEADQAEEG
jgi:hypothetical protein